MNPKRALNIVLIISALGILFSGYLSYSELLNKSCALGSCTNVATVPACVYGLIMYLALFIVALLGKLGRTEKKEKKD